MKLNALISFGQSTVFRGLFLFLGMASFSFSAYAEEAKAYKYELTALGAYAGEAVFSVGLPEKIGSETLRPIQIEGKTSGLVTVALDAWTRSTTWVNTEWMPVRSRSTQKINQVERVLSLSFNEAKVGAKDTRKEKIFREVSYKNEGTIMDLVSIFPYLMANMGEDGSLQKELTIFDGFRLYKTQIEAGDKEDVALNIGVREAVPLKISISRGKYHRNMTLWVSADKERVPLKFVFKYGNAGTVEAQLVSEKRS